MVLAFCRLTGRNSTVLPKGTPNLTSFEPLICPWEALLLQDHHTLPKRNIHLQGYNTLPKQNIFSELIFFLRTDLAISRGVKQDGDTHTSRHDCQDGLEC